MRWKQSTNYLKIKQNWTRFKQRPLYYLWWHGAWYILGPAWLIITIPGWLPVVLASFYIQWREDQ